MKSGTDVFLAVLVFCFILLLLNITLSISLKDWQQMKISLWQVSEDLLISFLRVSISTFIAWFLGIPAGFLLHKWYRARNIFLPFINFVRHISPFAWLPFAIFWFGLGEDSVAFVMLITLFFPTVIITLTHFASIPKEFVEIADVMGANRFQIFRYIELPLSLVHFLNLFRVIWGLGWSVIIAAEMLGVKNGMGYRLLDFRYLMQYPEMLIYLIILGGVGIVIDLLLRSFVAKIDLKIN